MTANQQTDKYACPYCRVGWVILPHELHCGFCGRRVFAYEIELEDKLLYSDNNPEEPLTLTVTNTGLRPIQFEPIATSPQNAIQVLRDISQIQLQPGKSCNISLRVNAKSIASNGTVTVKPRNGKLNEETREVRILPVPKFEVLSQPETAKEAIATICGSSKTTQAEFNLRVLESEFLIDDIECDVPWVEKIHFPKEALLKKDDRQYPVKVDVDFNNLDTDTSYSTTLKFKLRSRRDRIDKSITIKPQLMPRLSMPTSNETKVVEGKTAPHSISVTNIGGGELIIQSATVKDNVPLFKQNTPYPLRLNANQTGTLDFQMDARDVEPGMHNFQIAVHSNCCEKTTQTYLLTVEVEEQTEYNYYIGIDFGTTNSCCAYIDESDQFKIKLVPLEPPPEGMTEWSMIIPSTIIYGDNYSGVPYRVGIHAEADRTGRNAPYYVGSAKRWLGYNWKRQFPISGNFKYLKPREVARDIIQYLVSRVEDELNQKVKKCVISYPTMFSRRQIDDLKWALGEIGFDGEHVKMIDEASAAALDYIYSRKIKRGNQTDSYTILVYDFGGGTIDIVLSQVTITEDRITVEPLSWGGAQRFGGDNVTQVIVDMIVEKCEKLVEDAVGSGANYKMRYFKPNQTFRPAGNTEVDDAIQRNSNVLYTVANEIKIRLTDAKEESRDFSQRYVMNQNDAKTLQEIINSATQEAKPIQIEIAREELEEKIEPELESTIRKIDEMVKAAQLPDVVILAGQSSQMPIVKKLIKGYFDKKHSKRIEINMADEPKACVSKGAGRYGATLSFPGDEPAEILDFSNKTHSRFGIIASDAGRLLFQEFIGKGRKIPDESYGIIDDYPLRREMVITVVEHFGTGNSLDDAEIIGRYTHRFPEEEVTDADLRRGQLEMEIKADESVEVRACIADNVYAFSYQRTEPSFLNED